MNQTPKTSALSNLKPMDNGFSLVELMITMAIIGILAGVAVPGFFNWLPDYYLKSATRNLMANFQLAKVTAIKSGHNCAITFNQPVDGDVYDYVVFEDGDNNLELGGAETIVRKVKWTDYHTSISTDANTFANNDDDLPAVAFRSNGIPRSNSSVLALGMGKVSIKNTKSSEADIILSAAGNIRTEITIN